ncbi:hypothetical protein EVAR_22946_1 [Eumeta japonica]|uniref:Uncharacterized protein n=1 Tax=Eumeta variegata TaxID=151549 RepID=A0A4C1UW65_EUMVA|nr:hypothetical protein EVAR_22946_1 [Eumeta japonica]
MLNVNNRRVVLALHDQLHFTICAVTSTNFLATILNSPPADSDDFYWDSRILTSFDLRIHIRSFYSRLPVLSFVARCGIVPHFEATLKRSRSSIVSIASVARDVHDVLGGNRMQTEIIRMQDVTGRARALTSGRRRDTLPSLVNELFVVYSWNREFVGISPQIDSMEIM